MGVSSSSVISGFVYNVQKDFSIMKIIGLVLLSILIGYVGWLLLSMPVMATGARLHPIVALVLAIIFFVWQYNRLKSKKE